MSVLEGVKYYEKGNFELETQAFSGTPSSPAYTGTAKKWYGLMEISLTASQDITNIAADDVADYLSMNPPLVMSGTVKITGMKISEYEELFNVRKDSNNMVLFGSSQMPKEIGMAFKNTGVTENGMVTNKFILFRTKVQLPAIGTQSIDADGNTIRDFTMNVTASYVKYKYTEGSVEYTDTATYGAFDSETNASIWNKIKDGIFAPNATLPA